MYLSMLNNEKRHLFLNLEIYMSQIDGDFSDKEKAIINAHCVEMHVDNNGYEPDMPRDEVFKQLKETLSIQEKKIVFLELVATIIVDNIYHASEKELVDKLAELLDISDSEVNDAFNIIKDMKEVYERCAEYIN